MAKNKVAALVYPKESAAVLERTVFPVGPEATFPGEWMPGEPIALSTIGLDKQAASKLIDDWDLPLKFTTADDPGEDEHARTGGMVSGATLPSGPSAVSHMPTENPNVDPDTLIHPGEEPRAETAEPVTPAQEAEAEAEGGEK